MINDLKLVNRNISCSMGYVIKGEPVQIIRIRDKNLVDVINLRNQLIYKIPISCLVDLS